MDTLCQELQTFGLTQYEAKTYLALLRLGRSNAYKVSKTAGVPRTRIYDILNALAEYSATRSLRIWDIYFEKNSFV
ncbi:helix-turn-helix domain-containing protein [Anaeromusa acidaminophila]|uniref:helix-turn-helix domain-containing protein n=1 Tax=Anaeromusa acidaminophila TaxID=81464 RepID=UPI000361A90E